MMQRAGALEAVIEATQRSRSGSSVITQDMDLGLERGSLPTCVIEETEPEDPPAEYLPGCIRDMIISYTLQTIWKDLERDAHQLRNVPGHRAVFDSSTLSSSSKIIPQFHSSEVVGKTYYLWSSLLHLRNQQTPFSGASARDKFEQLERLRAQERAGAPSKSKTWKSRGMVTPATEKQVRHSFIAGMKSLMDSEQSHNSRLQCALFDGIVRPPLEDVMDCIVAPDTQPSAHLRAWLRSGIEESVELIPVRWLSIFGQAWD